MGWYERDLFGNSYGWCFGEGLVFVRRKEDYDSFIRFQSRGIIVPCDTVHEDYAFVVWVVDDVFDRLIFIFPYKGTCQSPSRRSP